MRRSMILPTGRLRPVSLALAGVVLLGAVTSTAVSWATAMPDDVAVRVGGEDVTITRLDRRVDVLSAIYGVTAPESGKKLGEFRRAAAKSIAISTVLEQAAKKRKIVIATKSLQDELTKIIKEQNGSRASFVEFLGQKGLKESDVVDELRRADVTARLFAEVTADVPSVTKAEARAEYDERREEMRTPETRRLANIVVETQDEARDVVQRLKSGDDFGDVASSTSLDTTTSQAGGDLGQDVARTGLEPSYADAAFGVGKGEIFGPVRTESGWNVGRVLKVTPGRDLSYDDVEATLVSAITNRRRSQVWTTWLNRQVDDIGVEYADEYRPDDPRITTDEATRTGGS
ncbi:peptidyl-prolyl cis-trans isomerase [Aeromicrobium ginsengisoli]|nr:peptidyl-prolyl cis-trans isomerase [Aeromicrobium ginsengisoli]